jgi:hypothetical protein
MKFILFLALSTFSIFGYGQKYLPAKNKCTSYVYNLSTSDMRIRNICYTLDLIGHYDGNEYRIGQPRVKEYDNWKYKIEIADFDKLTKQTYSSSFYIYEDNAEFTQYQCIHEESEFKAIIYDKMNKCWQILLLQDDEYKIISCYTGYKFTNSFGIKSKSKSSISY